AGTWSLIKMNQESRKAGRKGIKALFQRLFSGLGARGKTVCSLMAPSQNLITNRVRDSSPSGNSCRLRSEYPPRCRPLSVLLRSFRRLKNRVGTLRFDDLYKKVRPAFDERTGCQTRQIRQPTLLRRRTLKTQARADDEHESLQR